MANTVVWSQPSLAHGEPTPAVLVPVVGATAVVSVITPGSGVGAGQVVMITGIIDGVTLTACGLDGQSFVFPLADCPAATLAPPGARIQVNAPVGRSFFYIRRKHGPCAVPCTLITAVAGDLSWVYFAPCGQARLVSSARVCPNTDGQPLWTAANGTVIQRSDRWETYCALDGTGLAGDQRRVLSKDVVGTAAWNTTLELALQVGADVFRVLAPQAASRDAAYAAVQLFFLDMRRFRPPVTKLRAWIAEQGQGGATPMVHGSPAPPGVTPSRPPLDVTGDELRRGLMGSLSDVVQPRGEHGRVAAPQVSGLSDAVSALGMDSSSSTTTSGDESSARESDAAETKGEDGARAGAGAGGPGGRGGRGAGRGNHQFGMTGRLQQMVAGGVVDKIFLKTTFPKLSTTPAGKGQDEAGRVQLLAMLGADTRATGGHPSGYSRSGATAKFFDTCTGEIKVGLFKIGEFICGPPVVGPTGLATEYALRTANGRSAAMQVSKVMESWLAMILGETGDESTTAKGVRDMVLDFNGAAAISPLAARIVGLRSEYATQRFAEQRLDSSDLKNALLDLEEIFAAMFGVHSPLVITAQRQRAYMGRLIFGRKDGEAGGHDKGIGVAASYIACQYAFGCVIVEAIRHAQDGNGRAVPWLDIIGTYGFPVPAWQSILKTRMERMQADVVVEGNSGIDATAAPAHVVFGPKAGVRGGAARAISFTGSTALQADLQQRAHTEAVSQVLVKAGQPALPCGVPRVGKKHESRQTDSMRLRDVTYHCPYFLAGCCIAGGECSLSHAPSTQAWPFSSGAFRAVGALFESPVGLQIVAP